MVRLKSTTGQTMTNWRLFALLGWIAVSELWKAGTKAAGAGTLPLVTKTLPYIPPQAVAVGKIYQADPVASQAYNVPVGAFYTVVDGTAYWSSGYPIE